MKIIKYPNIKKVVCDKCGTEFIFSRNDFIKHKCFKVLGNYKYGICPICEKRINLGKTELKIFEEEVKSIFKRRALAVKDISDPTLKLEVASVLDSLYNEFYDFCIDNGYEEEPKDE